MSLSFPLERLQPDRSTTLAVVVMSAVVISTDLRARLGLFASDAHERKCGLFDIILSPCVPMGNPIESTPSWLLSSYKGCRCCLYVNLAPLFIGALQQASYFFSILRYSTVSELNRLIITSSNFARNSSTLEPAYVFAPNSTSEVQRVTR
jgi:hypothetical protein